MFVSHRAITMLFEACRQVGIAPDDLTRPLGLDVSTLVGAKRVEWSTMNALLLELERHVGGNDAKLREIGRRFTRVPSTDIVQRLARTFVSPYGLYDVAVRWFSPVTFPGIRSSLERISELRIHIHAEMVPPYEVSRTFFLLGEGSFSELTTLLGLPPAVLVESRITGRSHDMIFELPQSVSALARLRAGFRAALHPTEVTEILDAEREELTKSTDEFMRARDELRAILERLPDLVLVHAAGEILWSNREASRLLGYGDAAGLRGIKLRSLLSPDAPDAALDGSGKTRPTATRFDIWLRGKSMPPMLVEAAPAEAVIFDGVPATLFVARDVTERVRMQQRLVTADRLSSIGLLAAGIAHEVNNPLAYVLNNIEIARSDLAVTGGASAKTSQALSMALEGVERIRLTVRDLLLLSRGDVRTTLPIDVSRVVDSVLVLSSKAIEVAAQLVREAEPIPFALGSESTLALTLVNLIANALDAMREKTREDARLVVRTAPASDGRILVEVRDNGVGISETDLRHVFEPFFTTKSAGAGTGLGLAIAQQLVAQQGGEILVTSSLGLGTSFQIYLRSAPAADCRSDLE